MFGRVEPNAGRSKPMGAGESHAFVTVWSKVTDAMWSWLYIGKVVEPTPTLAQAYPTSAETR